MQRVAWAVVIGFTALIVANTVPYFSMSPNFAFIAEKGSLGTDALWRASFYTHISGGLVCLVAGPIALWVGTRRLHRSVGKVYALAVLGWAGPSGFVLSFFAKGGLAGQSGFLLLTLLWFAATWIGVRAAMTRRLDEHRRWMLRSYALALSAIFFRIIQTGFYFVAMADDANYVASLWLSLVASLVVGEWLAHRDVVEPVPLTGVTS